MRVTGQNQRAVCSLDRMRRAASRCQFLKLDLNCHILEKALEVGMSITHGESYTLSEWQLLGWHVIPLYSTSLPHVFWSQLPER